MSYTANKQSLFATKGQKQPSKESSSASPQQTSQLPAPEPVKSKTAGVVLTQGDNSKPFSISAEAKQRKLNEAHEFYLKGEENLKTSFFQWQPDHLSAASNFERASELFRAAQQPKRALKAMIMSADEYEKCNTLSSSALNKAKAADLAKEIGDQAHSVELLFQSAETWGINGDLQKYGETLEKAAKELEIIDVKRATETHLKALEILCPGSTPKDQLGNAHPVVIDMARTLFSFFLRQKLYEEARKFGPRAVEIFQAFNLESGACKVLASITVLQIMTGDVIRAQQTYLQDHLSIPYYMRSKECEFIDVLILACINQDDDLLDKAKMHPQLNYLDAEIQTIVRQLSLSTLIEGELPSQTGNQSFDIIHSKKERQGLSDVTEGYVVESQQSILDKIDIEVLDGEPKPVIPQEISDNQIEHGVDQPLGITEEPQNIQHPEEDDEDLDFLK